jgi:hypothetical protein
MHNFKIMIGNEGAMNYGGKCENEKLKMGDYSNKFNVYAINMEGFDVIFWELNGCDH